MKFKVGDIVSRKSYNYDIIFKIYNIKKNNDGNSIVLLKGVNIRLAADSPESDLVHVTKDELNKNTEIFASRMRSVSKFKGGKIKKKYRLFGRESEEYMVPGKVIHIDGDGEYLKLCMEEYEKDGITAHGFEIAEGEQPKIIGKLLKDIRPDILVITGHDGIIKDGNNDYSDIKNYRNSNHFIKAVKEARSYEPSLDDLIIIAGACQSHYEGLILAGANFASSPERILIYALDPVKACSKLALTPIDKIITAADISGETLSGLEGIGGVDSKGKYRVGAPKPRFEYTEGGI